ncbi:hypothetical protein SKAU_G00063650 [Synaphobranchus kaupii]|uniref:Secreted protein n=1 Tax=Synaphobranchus kaupii TaxID=118154 RepID=A0A9Q1G6V8_SYNKA|nr:hypothetical protein SKAU_G00063650 [Synaphobranchus kaupii]
MMVLACWLLSVWPVSVLSPTKYSARLSTLSIPGTLRSSTASCCSGAAGVMEGGPEGRAVVAVAGRVVGRGRVEAELVVTADGPEGMAVCLYTVC